ncbi:KAP family P-loop NTPase fold protein [Pedobacter chitinilyticus]|uniref:KAP NTPase domain-containing protein n=1 Tax=Pedobacter chitinilyticus TaxID=2233776 RepID=A0A443YVY9_9SPHI|nr:P-loop NTPase fold protein [Pedobacter chitinilyticus]RWU08172.1 hypothetical protein DPV69_07260 [Pedobacter chitinilyticus]
MQTDKAITNHTEDKLNREMFVNALAQEILAIQNRDCTVIGLYGKWGAGKTSIIGLLEQLLHEKYYFTAYFNPWRYKSEDIILRELFMKIIEGARSDRKLESKWEKLGVLFSEYGQFISLPSANIKGIKVDFSKPLQGLVTGLGRLFKGKSTIDDKKAAINEILDQLAVPLVIFIDDVDRLDVAEIRSLFKLVKLTADFNKLIYIIAFDEDIVAKALAQNYGTGEPGDGKAFLEKIVQLPLRIPTVPNKERFTYTINLLNEWAQSQAFEFPEKYQALFVKHFKDLHDNFIKTPRDSKRLLNAVSFSYQCLRDEVNVYDIVLLETIRIFLPAVFDELLAVQSELFKLQTGENGYTINNKKSDAGVAFEKRINMYAHTLPLIADVTDYLFPFNNLFNLGFNSNRSEKIADLFAHQRVAIRRYFDRFTEFKIAGEDISDLEFKGILSRFNTLPYSELTDEIQRLCMFPKNDIYRLFHYFRSQLEETGKINVATMLCTKEHFYFDNSFESRFFRMIDLSLELLAGVGQMKRIESLRQIIFTCPSIHHSLSIIYDAQYVSDRQRDAKFHPIEALKDITKEYIFKIQRLPLADYFKNVDDEKCDILCHLIDQYGDAEKFRTELINFLDQKPENVMLFIKSMLPMSYINMSPIGQYSNRIDYDKFRTIEQYVRREVLIEKCLIVYPDAYQKIDINPDERQSMEIDHKIIIQYLLFARSEQATEMSDG